MPPQQTAPEQAEQRLAPIAMRPDNLTVLVFAAIRDRIVDASLPPGSPVSEAALAAQLQVSKTPVREALLRLRHTGLVEPSSRGLRVVEASVTRIRDAFEFRAGLEALAGEYASTRATKEQNEAILVTAQESLTAATDGRTDEFHLRDREFHTAVATASGNAVLQQALDDCFILTSALRQRDFHVARDFSTDAREHISIARSLAAGRTRDAASGLSAHIQRIMAQLLGPPA